MKSFKDYAKGIEGENKKENVTGKERADAEELTRKISEAYDGKSNMEMLKNILAEAEKSKRAGTLSNEEIERFYQSFSPMLDEKQKRQLRTIADKLKEI